MLPTLFLAIVMTVHGAPAPVYRESLVLHVEPGKTYIMTWGNNTPDKVTFDKDGMVSYRLSMGVYHSSWNYNKETRMLIIKDLAITRKFDNKLHILTYDATYKFIMDKQLIGKSEYTILKLK